MATPAPANACPQCGGAFSRRMRPGRTIRFRNIPAIEIPSYVKIPRCRRCHHEWIDEIAEAELEPVLVEVYRTELRHRFRSELRKVLRFTSQRGLERLLNLSQGYLSRLLAGAGTPSAELVSNVALIAVDPARRLSELERFWSLVPAHSVSPGRSLVPRAES